jgi:hypothetical protein
MTQMTLSNPLSTRPGIVAKVKTNYANLEYGSEISQFFALIIFCCFDVFWLF